MPFLRPWCLLASVICQFILPPAMAQDVKSGKALAERLCARCHAVGATDKSALPKAPSFRDIANRYSVWTLQEALAEGIVTAHEAMPEFVLNPDEIVDLLTYMDTFTIKKSDGRGKAQ